MMEYFNHKLSKKHHVPEENSETPVLTDEDEEFLQRIASEGTPPPLPRDHRIFLLLARHGMTRSLP
jgi:hypothetical protein